MAKRLITIRFEADDFDRIRFLVHRDNRTESPYEVDCSTQSIIEGLKIDLSHLFGIQAHNQIWKYNEIFMENIMTLHYYGVNSRTRAETIIHVYRADT